MKNVQLLNVSTSLLALSLLASICFGCGAEGFDQMEAPPGAEEVEQVQQEIRGVPPEDDNIYKKGVVDLGNCTGTMVGKYAIITAAHCVSDGYSGRINRTIQYFDPYRNMKRDITHNNELLGVIIKSDYNGSSDPPDDLAIVYRLNYQVWGEGLPQLPSVGTQSLDPTTTSRDWVRLSDAASCPQIDRLTFYGRGDNSFAGTGSGVLRRRAVNLSSCFDDFGNLDFFADNAGQSRVCKGDSGGPYMMSVNGWDVVTGVFSNFQIARTGTKNCTKEGGYQRAARLSQTNINWVIDAIGRDKCTRFYGFSERHPTQPHHYWRCW